MHFAFADYLSRGVELWADGNRLRYRLRPGLDSDKIIRELTLRKPELLLELTAITDKSHWHPITDNQQALFLHQALWPNDPAYNVGLTLRLRDSPSLAHVQRALLDLGNAHPSLLRIYKRVESKVYQQSSDKSTGITVEEALFEDWAAAAQAAAVFERLPFALEGFLLARACLFRVRTSPDVSLHLSFHHLNVDFWSLGLILLDLQAALSGTRLVHPESDGFLMHVRADLLRPAATTQLVQWRRRIAAGYEPFILPTAHSEAQAENAVVAGGAPARSVVFSICGAQRAALATVAKRVGATEFVIVLAAYILLLARLAGTDRPSVCIPTLGRAAGQRDIVGYFVNPLPVFADLGSALTIDALVDALRREVAEALDAVGVSYAWVVGETRLVGHDTSQAFPAFLNWNTLPSSTSIDLENVGLSQVGGFCRSMLTVMEVDGDYRANWTCDADAAPFLRLWTDYFLEMIDWLVDQGGAGRQLSERPVIGSADVALIEGANSTGALFEPARSIADVISDRCTVDPKATALRFRGEDVSYAELDRRAAAVAAELQARNVRAGDFVGICMERCLGMIPALLGILRAGAAFVPLDPSWPEQRLRDVSADARLTCIITDTAADGHPGFSAHAQFAISDIGDAPDNPIVAVPSNPDRPAYMLFTSGSTGRPKGVVIDHRAIHNRLFWMQTAYPLGPGDRVLQKTPATFDVSVWEFFWPLMFGASLVIAEPESHKDPEWLAQVIAAERITHIHFVPSMLALLLDYPAGPPCPALRHVFCSGEALPPATVGAFFDRHPSVRLHNLYGPTEAAIDVSFYECRLEDRHRTSIPIGRPTANTHLHVLDKSLRQVPVGVEGELFIEGVQLARGYHGRPELTAERFPSIQLPWAEGAARRLYRTGDLARWNLDGEVEYAGRTDDQIKLRGQRIELGEIAAVLNEHDLVKLAACVFEASATPTILAVVVLVDPPTSEARQEHALNAIDVLRAHLLTRLPTYMIPAAISAVPHLPVTANGKLDRAAVVALCRANSPLIVGANENDAEPVLADLLAAWRRALGEAAPTDRGADFFLAGGDSIRAVRLIGDLADGGWRIDAQRLYSTPTLGALDRWLRLTTRGAPPALEAFSPPFALLVPEDRADVAAGCEDSYPLTALQEVMYGHTQARRGLPIYHDVFTIKLTQPIDPSAVCRAIQAATVAHPVLRTRLRADTRGGFVQDVQAEVTADFVAATPPAGQSFDTALAQLVESQQEAAFDFEHGPLFRLRQLTGDAGAALVLSFHHLILDGWSVASLIRQLLVAATGGSSPAPTGAYRFADYVALERAASENREHREHWTRRLSNAPATLLGLAANTMDSRRGMAHAVVPLSWEAERSLRDRADRWGMPLKSVCMALHCRALMAFLDRDVITTSYVVDGRLEASGYETVLGLHLNTVPLVASYQGNSEAFIRNLRRQEVENLPHRRFPLLEILRGVRSSRTFNTVFNFTDFHIYNADQTAMELVADITVKEFTDYDVVGGFSIHPSTGRLTIQIDYEVSVMSAAAVERLRACYAMALDEFITGIQLASDAPKARPRDPTLAAMSLRLADVLPTLAALPEVENVREEGVDGSGRMAVRVVPARKALPHYHHRPTSDMLRHRLADGLEVACLNRSETDFNYRETFTDGVLTRYDLDLPQDAIVFDVGANVGLFSLFVHGLYPSSCIYAFEPAPNPFAALVDNMAAYRVRGNAMARGLSASSGEATLAYYPTNTLISGFHANDDDLDVTWRSLANARSTELSPDLSLPDEAGLRKLFGEKLDREMLTVTVSTVSDEIHNLGLDHIDLLKIDVEKSELDVLHGIDEDDWPKIGSVLLEVHDIDHRLEAARRLLERHGFACLVEQDRILRGTDIHSLLATRGPPRVIADRAPLPWRYSDAGVSAVVARAISSGTGLAPEHWSIRLARPDEAAGRERAAPTATVGHSIRSPAPPLRLDELSLFQSVWTKLLGDRPFAPERSFYEQGVDSITLLRLLRGVNSAFGSAIPVASVNADLNASGMLALRGSDRVIVTDCTRVSGARTLVLVVPFGASPEAYRALISALGTDHTIRLLALADSAYEGRDLHAVARDYWPVLQSALIGVDLLVGWSLGGNLALALSVRSRIDTGVSIPVALLDSHVIEPKRDDASMPTDGPRPKLEFGDDHLRLMRLRPETLVDHGLYIAAGVNPIDRSLGARSSRGFLANRVERSIEADHFGMLKEPCASSVAKVIASYCRGDADMRS